MQLNVTGHHVDVTTSLKGYVEKKLDRIVRHSDHVTDVHCILTVEKLRHKAEATVALRGATVYADATDADMYAAIDALAEVPTANQDRRQFKRAFGQLYVLNTPDGGTCCAPRA